MDDENEGNNADRNVPLLEDDVAARRNQVLIFGVVLLGILAICLAVSMPSDLEFNDSKLPTSAGPMSSEVNDDRPPLTTLDGHSKRNITNSTNRKKDLRSPEVSVEVKLLRNMAIQKRIQEYDNSNTMLGDEEVTESEETFTEEEQEVRKVSNIVETFVASEDFEDFLIDMEIHDAVTKLRAEKGYKSKPSTIFDELFKRVEKEFIGDDEEELSLIRKVGEELEQRARSIIDMRRKSRGTDLTEPEVLIASELLKLDYSGSGDSDMPMSPSSEGDDDNVMEITKAEL